MLQTVYCFSTQTVGSAALKMPPLTSFFLCYFFLLASLGNCSTQMYHRMMERIIKSNHKAHPAESTTEPCPWAPRLHIWCWANAPAAFARGPPVSALLVSAKTMHLQGVCQDNATCKTFSLQLVHFWYRCRNGFQSYSCQVPLRCCRRACCIRLSVKGI